MHVPLSDLDSCGFHKTYGRSGKRWGFGAAIGLYLLVFWDQIPTYVLHKYYCATEAGVWVYKTPEQWKAENPGVAETLTQNNSLTSYRDGQKTWYILNQRFHWVIVVKPTPIFPVERYIYTVEDIKTGEFVLKKVEIYSGYKDSGWNIRNLFVGCGTFQPDWKIYSEYKMKFEKIGEQGNE